LTVEGDTPNTDDFSPLWVHFVYSNHDHDLLLIMNMIEKFAQTLYPYQFDHDHFYDQT
jgi:hypothetical protein